MDEKVFELLTKMYSEMNIRFDSLEKDMKIVKHDIGSLFGKIDSDIDNKLKSLQDGYTVNYELTTDIRDKVVVNTVNIDEINISMNEIKEDINYLAGKTIKHDRKIEKIVEQLKTAK